MKRLVEHVTPLGRVLIAATIVVAVALVLSRDKVVLIAAAAVCVLRIAVYFASSPSGRRRRGESPGADATSWRDREL
jgi:hypothetical protein